MAEHYDDPRDHRGSPHGNPGSFFCSLLYPVQLPGSHVLSRVGGHSRAEREVGHHGKSVHPHDDNVGGDDNLPKAVGQRLNHNHGQGKDGLGHARGKPQA